MLGKLYLLKNFNNYFNRKVIRYTSLSDYLPVGSEYFVIGETNGVNFNPNDGVSTEHVIGSAGVPFTNDWNPDYCLYVEEGNIISRWFVTKSERLRDKQYLIRLKRDSIADYYNVVLNAPIYVEKGYLLPTDSMVVNSEGMRFNQIKKSELFLKDKTKCPWIIIYLKQDRTQDYDNIIAAVDNQEVITGAIDLASDPAASAIFLPNSQFRTKATLRKHFYNNWNFGVGWWCRHQGPMWWNWGNTVLDGNMSNGQDSPARHSYTEGRNKICQWGMALQGKTYTETSAYFRGTIRDRADNIYPAMDAAVPHTGDDYNDKTRTGMPEITDLNKIYKYGNKYYKAFKSTSNQETVVEDRGISNAFIANAKRHYDGGPPAGGWTWYDGAFVKCWWNTNIYNYELREIQVTNVKTNIKKDNRHSVNVPYDILAIPLGAKVVKKNGQADFTTQWNIGVNMARAIILKLGTFSIDVQILPYCPCYYMNIIDSNGNIVLTDYAEHTHFEYIVDDGGTNDKRGVMFYAQSALNVLELDKVGISLLNDEELNVSDVLTVQERKIESQTDMYRLSSPNYASSFEFNLAKCVDPTGSYPNMTKFKVDVVYRPFNPYIHIAPDFAFLYGNDFNDSRGLICSGDFGLTTLSDPWVEYQNRNKNYQNIFDRQMTNMEVMRGIEREQEMWNQVAGPFMGAGIGTLGGAKAGMAAGPWGAAAGAAIGGTAGAVLGGIGAWRDRENNEKAYQENRQFSIDMFNMQLENIQAAPDTITHTASISANFKFYPVLEHYTCTDEEKNALREKIKYNGMTVGRIDHISNYMYSDFNFFKGQVIRLEGIDNNSQISMDVYNEINKGIFIKSEE